jgi:hypothetical protein
METQSTSTDKQSTKNADSLSISISRFISGIAEVKMLMCVCVLSTKIFMTEAAIPIKAAMTQITFDTTLHNLCDFIRISDNAAAKM